MARKLSVGETLSEVFEIYKAQAGVLLPIAFWLFLVVSIVAGIAGDNGSTVLLLVSLILGFVAGLVYQGMVVSLVRDVQDGRRDLSAGELYRAVTPVLGTLVVASIVLGIAIGVGFFLLIVPGCILLTIWAVVAPAIVIERRSTFDAAGRSRELVRGNGWPVFGTVIVAALITIVVSSILGAIGGAIAGGPILRIVFAALASTVTAPITALVAGVLYYKLLELRGESSAAVPDAPPLDYTPPDPPPPPAPGPGATA
jgi:hypothetical protein